MHFFAGSTYTPERLIIQKIRYIKYTVYSTEVCQQIFQIKTQHYCLLPMFVNGQKTFIFFINKAGRQGYSHPGLLYIHSLAYQVQKTSYDNLRTNQDSTIQTSTASLVWLGCSSLKSYGSWFWLGNYSFNNTHHNYRAICTSPNRLASFNPTSWQQWRKLTQRLY